MKLLILGATGKVGSLVLAQALEQGHSVTALLRNPAKIKQSHAQLTIVQGDARDPKTIASAMSGMDAIISALGHAPGPQMAQNASVLTEATQAILDNLAPHQRFISLTGDGAVLDPKDAPIQLGGRIINGAVKLLPNGVFSDGVTHAKLLQASSADWILVRSPRMANGAASKNYKTGYLPIGFSSKANRADVADFMLANLTNDQWLRQSPIIVSA
jgi:uncharacterized protein YbjT (DUF2867 family)